MITTTPSTPHNINGILNVYTSGPTEGKKVRGCHHYWTLKFLGMPVTPYVLLFRKSGGASGNPGTPGSADPALIFLSSIICR